MKHKVTVEVETKKHFLGISYKTTEKKRIMVDGKTYRKLKKEERERDKRGSSEEEAVAAAYVVLEEEWADRIGE